MSEFLFVGALPAGINNMSAVRCYLTIIHRRGDKDPSLSPTLRWIIVLVYTTQAEILADQNVILCVTSGRKFKNLPRRLLVGE